MSEFRMEATNIGQYIDDVQDETINSNQAVQRDFVWTAEMIDNLIYSATSQKVFIPNLILAEENKGDITTTYIVDGNQRTEALRRFKYDNYKVSVKIRNPIVTYDRKKLDENNKIIRNENGEVIWETVEFDLRKKTYDDLPVELQRKFNKCPLMITIYQDRTTEGTSELVNLYNNHAGMNVSQKSLTYVGKYANEIKRIKDNNKFLMNGTALTENEKHKGNWERIISESVMGVFHMNEWKKDPKKMCSYLNDNSSTDEFLKMEEYFNRIEPYSDKLNSPKIAELFVAKDIVVWMKVFDKFTKLNRPDEEFGKFIKAFSETLREEKVNDITWNELDTDKHTKDKSVIKKKVEHIITLMNEFLHIDSTETENNVSEETTLSFVQENANPEATDEDVNAYSDLVDYCFDHNNIGVDAPIYQQCQTALIALMAYACENENEDKFEEWINKYKNQKKFSPSQKVNYDFMKRSFDKMAANA